MSDHTSAGSGWRGANIDPSAGVKPWPKSVKCPRCGVEKGRDARKGLCADCVVVLGQGTPEHRAWLAA